MSNTDRRFNAVCPRCKTVHTTLAHVTREIAQDAAGHILHGNLIVSAPYNVFETADGFKLLGSNGGEIMRTCACGRAVTLRPVHAKLKPDHKCDARCTHAKGGSCECSCGGKNHGAGWAA